MNDKRKTIIILVVCIISLLLIMGGSFSAWYYNHVGDNDKIQVHDVELEFLESDSNVISIDDAFPMIDEKGKKQEDTFDFEVKSKTKKTMPIAYNLVLEKVGMKCSEIDKITQDEYPSCFDYTISEEDEIAVITWMKSSDSGLTEEQTEEYYHSFVSHDNNRIYSFFYNMFFEYGATEEQAEQVAEMAVFEAEKKGYEKMLIDSYQEQTGNVINAYTFNAEGITYDHYLSDNQVKIYLEDYQGNVILEPTLISEISYDYVLHKKVSTHSPENEEYKNKYKLRVWIDEETDSSDWNETTDLNYEFKIGVESRPPSYEVKYDANGGTSGLTTISEGAYAWTNENGVWKSNNTDEYGTESTLTTEEFTVEEEATLSFDWSVASNSDSDYLYYTLYKDDVPVEGTGIDTRISGFLSEPGERRLLPAEEIVPSTLEKQSKSNMENSFKEIASAAPTEDELYYQTITHKLGPGKYVLEFKYIKEAIQPKESNTIYAYDKGYVKNIKLSDGMNNSVHVIGISSNLNSNIY